MGRAALALPVLEGGALPSTRAYAGRGVLVLIAMPTINPPVRMLLMTERRSVIMCSLSMSLEAWSGECIRR